MSEALKTILDLAIKGYARGRALIPGPIDTWLIVNTKDPDVIAEQTAGDTLLRFLINEMVETFEEGDSKSENLDEAINKLDTAILELEGAQRELRRAWLVESDPDVIGWYDKFGSGAWHVFCAPSGDGFDLRQIVKADAGEHDCESCELPITSAVPPEEES